MSHEKTVSGVAVVLAESLQDDPFYQSLVVDCRKDAASRLAVLARYFEQSIGEARDIGHVRQEGDDGCAVWITGEDPDLRRACGERKRAALSRLLGRKGFASYLAMVDNMERRLPPAIPGAAWYLSILGVAAACRGTGIGARLLAPTLAAADARGAVCYLETFNPRSVPFYARQGFAIRQTAVEPLTSAPYQVMVREPKALAAASKGRVP